MARITVVTSSSAPQATWATVEITMLASGTEADWLQRTRVM